MPHPIASRTLRAFVSSCALSACTFASAAVYYATPAGAGLKNGTSWSNAYDKSQIQSAANSLAAGDTLQLGSGTYASLSIQLTGSGTSASPKTIIGVDTGGGLPLAQGTWSETAPATSPAGSGYVVQFTGTAAYWTVKDIRVANYYQALSCSSSGSFQNLTLDNIDADRVRDGLAFVNVTNSVVRNCDVIRHTKKGFRLSSGISFVTFENCTADANGGADTFPNENFPNGFYSDSSSSNHDVTYVDCTARNQRMPNQATMSYWNSDGFSSESSSYNYRYLRCKAFNNHDAGFDDKASNTVYDSCVSIGNKRGYRYWGNDGVMVNSLAAYSASWGDIDTTTGTSMPAHGLWVSGSITVSQSTFHNAVAAQIYTDTKGLAVVNDSILSVDGTFANGPMTGGNVILNRSKQYAPGSGPDAAPNYVAPSRTWTGTPANAFDSQTYTNPDKGYYQATGSANVPPTVALGALPFTSGMAPLAVNFTATATETDGTIVSYAWAFGNGATSSAQNPTYTYTTPGSFTAQVTVTDNAGAIAVKRIAIQVIAANAGSTHYVTPTGTGGRNGSSWTNAYAESDLQALLNSLDPGDTVSLGSGSYISAPTLVIPKGGTSAATVVIQGVDTGSGLPLFDGTFDVVNSANSSLFSFGTGSVSYVTIRNLRFRDQPWVFDLPQSGTTDTLRHHLVFENLAFDTIEDAIRLRNASNVTVRNCSVIRYTKKAFRISDYSRLFSFENCSADCTGGNLSFPARAVPNGFFCDDTGGLPIISDITFTDCVARNNGYAQAVDSYWNGDGFSSERGATNIRYIRCQSYNNNDAGFDDKADQLTYQDCVAAGNKRQYRIWGTGVLLDNCLGVNAEYASATGGDGGTGARLGLWLRNTAIVTAKFSTFHNAGFELETGGQLTIEDSIVSKDEATTSFWTGSGVTAVRTATYSPLTGTNPQYVAPSTTWRGSPANAYDSVTYGVTKGYNSVYSDVVISVNLTDAANVLAASDVVGAVPAANWNNTTANNEVLTNVVDCFGNATTADLSFSSTAYAYNNNTPALAAPLTDDAKMMRSQRALSNSSTMTMTAAQVPYATYDVYVYWGGRVSTETVPATMAVSLQLASGSTWVTSETKYIRDDNRTWDGTYNESVATTSASAADGNEYVVFRNVTAPTFRVSATCGVRTGFCGVQIVKR